MTWHVLADEFSWQAWKYEGAQRVLPPKGIINTLRWNYRLWQPPAADVDFLLIESAWENFRSREDRFSAPVMLANAYRRAGIPVIFWNKEDPLHFDRFLPLALASDVVLTTDADCVVNYRNAGCSGEVAPMTFAAQPQLHRQYLDKDPDKRVFFAGTLRAHHDDRMGGFRNVVLPAMEFGLHILSRKGSWPDECQHCVVGSYPYLQLVREYSQYHIGLNISSILDSPTMFPRRVVEMPMADIFVVSDECRAVRELFPEIPRSGSARRTTEILEYFLQHDQDREQVIESVRSRILSKHTCAHRLAFLRECIAATVV